MSILLDFLINMLYFKIKILENSIFGKFSFYREINFLTIFFCLLQKKILKYSILGKLTFL